MYYLAHNVSLQRRTVLNTSIPFFVNRLGVVHLRQPRLCVGWRILRTHCIALELDFVSFELACFRVPPQRCFATVCPGNSVLGPIFIYGDNGYGHNASAASQLPRILLRKGNPFASGFLKISP